VKRVARDSSPRFPEVQSAGGPPVAPIAPVTTVGTFDGVHLGHRRVLETVMARAAGSGGPSVAVTFDRHPLALLDPAKAPDLLTSLDHKLLLMENVGVDAALVLEFDRELAELTAAEFLRKVVARGGGGAEGGESGGGGIGAAALVLGEGARLGSDQAGGDELAAAAAALGIEVEWVEPVVLGDGDERVKVSSTEVRRCILENDLLCASRLLGRPVTVLGEVVRGLGRGRELGFGTANLDLRREVRPPTGIYATWASLGEGWAASVSNVGPSPDQIERYGEESEAARVVEVHMFDFDGDLYGRQMEVAFCGRLRDERQFESDEALSEQIARDAERARELLAASRPPDEEILA